jgi:methylglyoxal synthase
MKKYKVALIAHDGKKSEMLELAAEFSEFLMTCTLCATGTTGTRLEQSVGLNIEKLLSGPLGGDLQIGARIAESNLDLVVFLRDPMTAQPHEPDINALVRACDVHNIPCATNTSAARLLLLAISQLNCN